MKNREDLSQLPPKERRRLQEMTRFEREAEQVGYSAVAGVDEAGRGPLAGPVVAAACILPKNTLLPGINDSKKLTPKQRGGFFRILTSNDSIFVGVGVISHEEIDQINILEATKRAMQVAVQNLSCRPDLLLVDAVDLSFLSIPCQPLLQGDTRSQSIAAASIIAKETRDRIMEAYHQQWPKYRFDRNKGYGTDEHCKAIHTHGPCPIHRRSFEPIKSLFQTRPLA